MASQFEGVDRVLVVRGDEDDLWRPGELGQHPAEVQAVQARHLDVAEDDIDRVLGERLQGFGAGAGHMDVADPLVATEQERQLGAGLCLVVDDERSQGALVSGGGRHSRRLRPDAEFGRFEPRDEPANRFRTHARLGRTSAPES